MANGELPWRVGGENPRESARFRWPVCDRTDDWPWLALFERKADAEMATNRVNAYATLVAEGIEARRKIAELEAEVEAVHLLLVKTRFEGELDDDLADEIDALLGLETEAMSTV